jgi:phosphopantothenoylcysteine decarboxylase/phosphopantothenate--cysteine ligase
MGIAIANELFIRGANVKLVLGPSPLRPVAGVEVSLVQSALEMKVECERLFENADAAILAAAVADYRPASAADQKIKKTEDSLSINLVKNPDILESLGKKKNAKQVLVGFALETENEYDNALTKLKKKNLDFIVLNSLRDPEAGFGKDSNKITVIEANSKNHTFESKSKEEVARDIIELLFKYL